MSVKVETPEVETVSLVESPKNTKTHDEEDICELEHLRKLFIGGLASHTTEENLKQFYGKWGTVVDAVVMRDPTTKRSRGFGFITYTKASSVDEAQKNRPHIIDSKTVDPKRALPRPERETRETNISVKKLFVGGLKDNHDEKCLEEYFSKFGNVISVKILTDRTTGKRRGFAFIEYDDYDSVDKAILQKAHTIKYVVVDVKKSVYKQEKQQGNEAGTDDASANNGQKLLLGGQKPTNFRPPVPQQPMPPYQQGPPAPYPQGAPYNYWGPPQHPPPPQYGPYPQPPAPANGWNAPYAWNSWNAGPPPPQVGGPPANWYPNQWQANNAAPGPQPPSGPAPVGAWNAPPAGGPPPPQCPPANFGNGYQQNYAAGPTKHNQPNTNRMHPYGPPQNSNYANGNQQPPPQGYNGYGAVKPPAASAPPKNGPPAGPPVNTAAQMANKFRR